MRENEKYIKKAALVTTITLNSSINCIISAEEPSQMQRHSGNKPNVIFVLVDDLGKEWVDAYGGRGIKLPNVNKLAQTGMKFHNVYSMPQCTPSRWCLLTGQYPGNNGVVDHWDVPRWGRGVNFDPKQYKSIWGSEMQALGYATAAAGKWQIDDFRVEPQAMAEAGFDKWCMWTGYETGNKPSSKRYWNPYLIYNDKKAQTYNGKFGPDLINDFVLDFVSKNKNKPFFIYYPMVLTHGPLVITPHDKNVKSKVDKHKAMTRYADYLLGKLITKLEELKIRDNTIIIWTTDNGTSSNLSNYYKNYIIGGGKGSTFENGINAPFIVSSPGLIPQNTESNALVDFTDMMPTTIDIAGGKLPKGNADGYSIKDILYGTVKNTNREVIVAYGGGRSKMQRVKDGGIQNEFYFRDRVIRHGNWKVFVSPEHKIVKLINVKTDLEENINLLNKIKDNIEASNALKIMQNALDKMAKYDKNPRYESNPVQDWETNNKKEYARDVDRIAHPKHPIKDKGNGVLALKKRIWHNEADAKKGKKNKKK